MTKNPVTSDLAVANRQTLESTTTHGWSHAGRCAIVPNILQIATSVIGRRPLQSEREWTICCTAIEYALYQEAIMADDDLTHAPMHPGMLLWYLSRFCAQRDAVQFFDAAGDPDIYAARAYAEQIRSRLRGTAQSVMERLTIEQRYHEVIITSTLVVPPSGDKPWYDGARRKMISQFGRPRAVRRGSTSRSARGPQRVGPA